MSSPEGFRVRVPKTAELVAGHIRRQIVTGELKEDDALPPEGALMQSFTISRPTLREAFRILESEGLITVRRGARGGARVHVPSTDVAARYAGLVLQHRGATLADVLDARVIVEAPTARMLAGRRDRASIANSLQDWIDANDPADSEHFHEFNRLVVQLTGNDTLILLTAMLEHISDAAARSYGRAPHSADQDRRLVREVVKARHRLVALIRDGKGEEAENLWRLHLNEAGKALTALASRTVVDLLG